MVKINLEIKKLIIIFALWKGDIRDIQSAGVKWLHTFAVMT